MKNLKKIQEKEKEVLVKIRTLLASLNKKYNLKPLQILRLLEEEITISISIFNEKLSVLETVVKYLKDGGLSFHDIGTILDRDERNIWSTYNNAKNKHKEEFRIEESEINIPVSIFHSKLSALESVVCYLKENCDLSYHEIAVLLKRDDRTIWTVYWRVRKKNER